MATTVEKALSLMRGFAPEEYQYKEEYDNIGLIVGRPENTVTKILVCLDVTDKVIDEAIREGAQLIISHHPMIWAPVKNIRGDNVLGRKLLNLIEHKIAVYAAHTNLDFVRDGVNDFAAAQLGLRNVRPLEPYIDEEQGFGRVGELANKVFITVLKGEVESVFNDRFVRILSEPYAQVKKIAVINGAGGGDTKYVDMALQAGADCLITADVKHHVAVYAADAGLAVIEPQHYAMEHAYIARLVQTLRIEAKSNKVNVEVVQAESESCPRY